MKGVHALDVCTCRLHRAAIPNCQIFAKPCMLALSPTPHSIFSPTFLKLCMLSLLLHMEGLCLPPRPACACKDGACVPSHPRRLLKRARWLCVSTQRLFGPQSRALLAAEEVVLSCRVLGKTSNNWTLSSRGLQRTRSVA